MEKNFAQIWSEALEILKNEMSPVGYKTYVEVISPRLVDENTICFILPSSYHIDICKKRFLDLFDTRIFFKILEDGQKVNVIGYELEAIDICAKSDLQYGFKTKLDNGKTTLASICCVKDLKLYVLPVSELKLILPLKVIRRFQLPKDATKEEQEIFINELNDFHNTIIEKYKPFVKEIIDALQLTTSNIEPDVDIEKEKCKRKIL